MAIRVDVDRRMPERVCICGKRETRGFTLTEMMATTLILTLVATLMATGIPAAIDTYRKMVRVSNAQMALSTTLEVVRSELGLATKVMVTDDGDKVYYYNAGTGYWCSISNPPDEEDGIIKTRGLIKQVYKGVARTKPEILALEPYNAGEPLLTNESITNELLVRFVDDGIKRKSDDAVFIKLYVQDRADAHLAQVGEKDWDNEDGYRILTRFVS